MEIILLETLNKLGNAGDIVFVKDGFARNYLIPNKKAIIANKKNKNDLASKMEQINQNNRKKIDEANSIKSLLDRKKISLLMEANEEGNLYGNINHKMIIDEIQKSLSVSLSAESLVLGTIKKLGTYEITVRLYSNISASLQVNLEKKS